MDTHGLVPDLRGVWTDNGLRWMSQDEEGTVQVWEEGHDQPLFTLKPDYRLSAVWLSPGGNYLASSKLGEDGFVQIWNVSEGKLMQTLNASIVDLVWTTDEACIATATFNDSSHLKLSQPQVWDMASGKLLQTIDAQMNGVGNLAWSPDGGSLAYIDEEGVIHVWGTEKFR